mgnify:CR=1 FL=1
MPRTSFAAASLALHVHVLPHESLSFDAFLTYDTSLGLQLTTEPLFGLSQTVPARAQHATLGVAPTLQLLDAYSLAVALPVGAVLRGFVPEQHQYGLPEYLMLGVVLRAELHAKLGELVRVRIGPELQWIPYVDDPLAGLGAGSGHAFGFEAAI